MARRCGIALLLIALGGPTALGRAFEVKLLSGKENNGVWGTDEYEVRVDKFGTVRNLKLHGVLLMTQVARLYTAPVPRGGGRAPRTVQGEGVGKRGLSINPPTWETSVVKGKRVFRLHHEIAKPSVFDGVTLCHVDNAVTLTATGEISVVYDCRWVHTCRWNNFNVLLLFTDEAARGREFMGIQGDRIHAGRFMPSKDPIAARVRTSFDQLTIQTPEGPVHLMWDGPHNHTLSWAKHIQLTAKAPCVPYRGKVHRGTTGRIAYRILLPVSQQ